MIRVLPWSQVFACIAFSMCCANAQSLTTPPDHVRPPEQTYLTYPEWYLVHSPAEYAVFLKEKPPNEFPFTGHIRQFWQSYHAVWTETRNRYPVNFGYHLMVSVIGVSTTAEYGLKSAYERLIGRLSHLTQGEEMTAEDKLAAEVAQDYVDFIRIDPWYKYDFGKRLGQVWTTTGFWGPDFLRKWERKYALTTEYAAKGIYAWIIGRATSIGYEAPNPVTAVVTGNLPVEGFSEVEGIEVLKQGNPSQSALLLLPRYQAFTDAALQLADQGIDFFEIAGNRDEILISFLAPHSWSPESHQHAVVLRQPILTRPEQVRYLVKVPIAGLTACLRELVSIPIEVEHIYDF